MTKNFSKKDLRDGDCIVSVSGKELFVDLTTEGGIVATKFHDEWERLKHYTDDLYTDLFPELSAKSVQRWNPLLGWQTIWER